MRKEVCKIVSSSRLASDNIRTVYFSANFMEHLDLKDNSRYKLICGIKSMEIEIKAAGKKIAGNNKLYFSNDILRETLIPEGIPVEVIFTEEVIKIGPIIAVLTEKKFLKDYFNGADAVEEFKFYADIGEAIGAIIYIFTLENLNIQGRYINGIVPVKGNNKWIWQKQRLPMPEAVCNRMAFAAASPGRKRIKLIEKIVPDIKIVNSITKISKWQIAKILMKETETNIYVPETNILRNPEDITGMLEKFSSVYLKPVRRSLGLGIIKIEKNSGGNYAAYYNIDRINYRIDGDINSILERLKGVMGKRGYIVQQGIQSAVYNKNPFDIRVTIQKDETGEWSFTRWVARIAAPGNIVTNVAAGGKSESVEKVLGNNFGTQFNSIMDEIKRAGLIISRALDKKLKNIGDLGLDIGVDMLGKVYLFEVNFRAIRPASINFEDAGACALSYYKPVCYLKYLYDKDIINKYNPQS